MQKNHWEGFKTLLYRE